MRSRSMIPTLAPALAILTLLSVAVANAKSKKGDAADAAPAAAAGPAGGSMNFAPVALPGVPTWQPPAEYRVDMVMHNDDQTITMHRTFRGGDIRSEMAVEGNTMIMIERAAEPGITYNLMPEQKTAMKLDVNYLQERAGKRMGEKSAPEVEAKVEAEAAPAPSDAKIEKLGTETLDGHDAAKFKLSSEGRSMLAWFDAASGAPLRMEAEGAQIEWKNYRFDPVPAKEFEIPKNYELVDVAEQMKQIDAMGGSRGMGSAALSGLAGMGGLGGMGAGGGVEGMAGQYGQRMGTSFGQQMGAGIGASFGGPLGAIAGQYIGGKVGGWVGHRAATAVTPDVGPGSQK